jgi:hypothetical protein
MDTVKKPDSHHLIELAKDNPMHYSRILRLELLANHPDGMWLDADAVLLQPFDFPFEEGFPYCTMKNGCVASAMYCNGRQDIFMELLEDVKKRNVCPCVFVKKRMNEFKIFPAGYILHLQLGKHLRRTGDYQVGNSNFLLSKHNDQYTLKIHRMAA